MNPHLQLSQNAINEIQRSQHSHPINFVPRSELDECRRQVLELELEIARLLANVRRTSSNTYYYRPSE